MFDSFDFYTRYYKAIEHSKAHAEFCERVFGINLAQHGFADQRQLELLIEVTRLGPQSRALDLGCGNGMIAEYLSDRTGAHITGLDFIPEAVRQARERTRDKSDRLSFVVGDMNNLELAPHSFDTILSVDTLYFPEQLTRTLAQLKEATTAGGQMGIYYAQGREPWVPVEEFDRESIEPDRTPLARALSANHLTYRTIDLTPGEYRLARLRKEVLTELRPQFEAEGILFIYENRMGDAEGIASAIEEGLHRRYLYHVSV